MLALTLVMHLASSQLEEARLAPRLRAAFGGTAVAGLGGYAVAAGPGGFAELGLILQDRWSVVARLTFGTVFVVTCATGGIAVDFAVTDQWSVSVGPSLTWIGGFAPDLPSAIGAGIPLRVGFSPFPRRADVVRRSGLVVFLELNPGVTLISSAYLPPGASRGVPVTATAAFGIGHAWW